MKAVLLAETVEFPPTHNVAVLFTLLRAHAGRPEEMDAIEGLSEYAVASRYSGDFDDATAEEYLEALRRAGLAFAWAQALVSQART